MSEPAAKSSARGALHIGALLRPLRRTRHWFAERRRFRKIMQSLDEGIALVQRHGADLAAIQPRLQNLEEQIAELAAMQPKLLKLQSAWRQQAAVQRHTIEVFRAQPNLVKLQSALRQQI